jgi:catechol 2,3-dioxygenase-like lactoylglutathione lyase family enzyme
MPLPVPTLDHVVINVRDQADAAAEAYRRLGFSLTPRGYHTLGTVNHLAMFGTDYLELIAVPPGETRRPEIANAPHGLLGLVFGSEDSAATYAALRDAGMRVEPPLEFSRPVALTDRTAHATFRTVQLAPGTVRMGRLYFCHHLTRDLVWRDEWRHHPNGVIAIARVIIAANDPTVLGELFTRMFGHAAVRRTANGVTLAIGLSRCDVITPAALAEAFDGAAPHGDGRPEFMAGLTFHTCSLDTAAKALEAGQVAGVKRDAHRIVVPHGSAFGAAIEFRD